MESLGVFLQGFSPIVQLLIAVVLLFLFQDEIRVKLFGRKAGETDTPEWAGRLEDYFNHETTKHNKDTNDKLDRLLAMEEKEHEANQALRETLQNINNTLQNFDKYGIPCREKK